MEKTEDISKKLLALNALFILAIICMFFVIYASTNEKKVAQTAIRESNKVNNLFENVSIEGKSAYVFDIVKNEVIYKKNEFVQLPLASITKLMTAITAIELVPRNSRITIKKEFLLEEGDTGLLAGESWNLDDLLDFSLMVSSNDGARSVASVIGALNLNTTDINLGRKDFISKMNEKAVQLGLKQTYFINESGLDEGLVAGGSGSAIDVSKLMQYILSSHPEILEATRYSDLSIPSIDKSHTAKNTNIDVNQISGLIASKTGYTDMAGGNLVIAFDASIGRPIVVVVLGSTVDGRFTDVSKLVAATRDYISSVNN